MKKNITYFRLFIAFSLSNLFFSLPGNAQQRCATTIQQWENLKKQPWYQQQYAEAHRLRTNNNILSFCDSDSIFTIPVAVHIVYSFIDSVAQNLGEEQIQSQIDAMNEDYSATNATMANIPSVWTGLVKDSKIRFALAKRDPSGAVSNGITRNLTLQSSFDPSNQNVKHFDSSGFGGADAWPASSYLNIWVCNLDVYLGYATFPGGTPSEDGLVINYKAFGRTGDLLKKYNLGRTGTHEAGHWLRMLHIWGDDGGLCEFDTIPPDLGNPDHIYDTPDQTDATYGNPSFPKYDRCTPSGNGIMFMNYMDYSDDKAMIFFTSEQVDTMVSVLHSFWRDSICASLGAIPPIQLNADLEVEDILSPVIQTAERCFHPVVRIKNNGTTTVTTFHLVYNMVNGNPRSYDWNGSLLSHATIDLTLPVISGVEGINILEARITDSDDHPVNNYHSRSIKIAKENTKGCENGDPVAYPNPVVGNSFCVKSNFLESGKITIRVINILGQKIYEEKEVDSNPGDVFPVYLGKQSRGIYIVQLISGSESRGTKILFFPADQVSGSTGICN